MKPVALESELLRFEAEHHIQLPPDYRDFLRHIGNGGAGPYYGILPLRQWQEAFSDEDQLALDAPNPLTPGLKPKSDWEELCGCQYSDCYQGAITICHQGCTYYALLIITGTQRGRVCNIDVSGQVPVFAQHPDFLSWYEGWLDDLLSKHKPFWYGLPK
jgi:hypothetical protein